MLNEELVYLKLGRLSEKLTTNEKVGLQSWELPINDPVSVVVGPDRITNIREISLAPLVRWPAAGHRGGGSGTVPGQRSYS